VWSDPVQTGGTPVLDYSIQMAVGTGSYSLVVSGLNLKTYTASNLITGSVYKFRVTATNKVGLGDTSDEVAILAA
jgi:hypothetical protein